jgi:hypothetical protein
MINSLINWIDDNLDGLGALAIFGLFFGCIGFFVAGKLMTFEATVTVQALSWERIQPVEEYRIVQGDSNVLLVPKDAYDRQDYLHHYYDSETCEDSDGDEYECGSWESEWRARYKVNRWVRIEDRVRKGQYAEDRVWPDFTPSENQGEIGALRGLERYEVLRVHVATKEGLSAQFQAKSEQEWKAHAIGLTYALRFNRFNEPLWETLRLEDRR